MGRTVSWGGPNHVVDAGAELPPLPGGAEICRDARSASDDELSPGGSSRGGSGRTKDGGGTIVAGREDTSDGHADGAGAEESVGGSSGGGPGASSGDVGAFPVRSSNGGTGDPGGDGVAS
ncbi:hypothetical protein F8O01_00250 [Pseudoclavibacter chungangensis]|uniref:Uncharacterized protein n=1 Tax=Pseudoclavibacter chungangensis TaxID=587635 RepID=A0A7J5C3R3_9MICO|nr:hypothetical protein [Pseudoclavibacter chungangensis]KAB1662420.1 hypothetical protein F8O01_00250 [Pseudoclavibacter chungangensis]NYJ68448.1 hypothetical protein [Pseudoclavibacter chungangensis]